MLSLAPLPLGHSPQAALPWLPAVPRRSVVSELLQELAEAEPDRVLSALARPVAVAAGLLEAASYRRHRHPRPVHPGTAGRNSQTRRPETGVPAAHQQTLQELGRLTEARRQFATAPVIIKARMGTERQIRPPSRRRCHRLAVTI